MSGNKDVLDELRWKKFSVLDHGHVALVDAMGRDSDIVEAARTSYQKGMKATSDDRKLLRYLFRMRHSTPFECCQLKFHIKLPIFVERQWARHRTAGWSEVSARYSELPDEYYIPDATHICSQSATNKQCSGEPVDAELAANFQADCDRQSQSAFRQYAEYLQDGIARETARINLPVSAYTEKVWWINLKNLLHFLGLRMESHAQLEIRQYATAIGEQIVKPLFPIVWEAFLDYQFNAMTLSRLDRDVINELAKTGGVATKEWFLACCPKEWSNPKCRERDECLEKLTRLSLVREE